MEVFHYFTHRAAILCLPINDTKTSVHDCLYFNTALLPNCTLLTEAERCERLALSCCAPVRDCELSPRPISCKSDTLCVDVRHFETLHKFVTDMTWHAVDVVTAMFCCVQGVWRETAVSDTCWLLRQPRRVSHWFHGISLGSVLIYYISFRECFLFVMNEALILSAVVVCHLLLRCRKCAICFCQHQPSY